MKEIELKFPVSDFAEIEKRFTFGEPLLELDVYYQHPAKDFLKTNEWLRIRTIRTVRLEDGEETRVTYKGPKEGAARKEIEIELNSDMGHELLEALGFRQLVVVAKERRMATWGDITVCLDNVSRLGKFVELEILAAYKIDEATELLYNLAKELGLEDEEKRGYAQMMLSQ